MADENIDLKLARLALEQAAAELSKFEAPAKPRAPDEPPLCSFCGAGRNNVETMIAGDSAYICGDCVAACQQIISEQRGET